MENFEAILHCTNCDTEWEDTLKNSENYSIGDMMECMLALWQGSGCPDCGWTEIEIKSEFCVGVCYFDGIRGEEDEDEEVTLKRSELDYLLDEAGFGLEEESEY